MGFEGMIDVSEDYENFNEIPPFKVKADPSILLNDEDYPRLRCNKQRTQAKKKWRLSINNYYDDAFDVEYHCGYIWTNESPL